MKYGLFRQRVTKQTEQGGKESILAIFGTHLAQTTQDLLKKW